MAVRGAALVAAGLLAVARAALPRPAALHDQVVMYRVINGECAQATLDKKLQGISAAWGGLREGLCEDQGFTEAAGSKAMDLPLLGQVTFNLYNKVDLLLKAVGMGAQAMGLTAGGPCCGVCRPPAVKYRSVDTANARCHEACVSPGGAVWLYLAADPNLREQAGNETCASAGFVAYNTTVNHGIPPMALSLDAYVLPPKDAVAFSNVVGGVCCQAITDKATSETQAMSAAGLERGYCVDRGHAEPAGSKEVELPVLGRVQLALFKRAGDLDVVDALRLSLGVLAMEKVALYQLAGDSCMELTLDRKYEIPAVSLAGFAEGRCKDQGYARPAGSKGLPLPGIGDVKVGLYAKAGQPQVIV